MAPDGSSLTVARNGADGSALVVVRPAIRPAQSAVTVHDLGSEHRIRGAAYPPRGNDVYASALGHVARYSVDRPEVQWRETGYSANLVAVSASGDLVLATPGFDEARGSGGLLVADPDGNLLRVVELPDISPYTLAIQP